MDKNKAFPGLPSILIANALAKGHYETGMSRYELIRSLPRGNQDQNSDYLQQVLELLVPAVTNVSLALELQLKILHFQHSGAYPSGHNVEKLGRNFPQETLTRLREKYLELRSNPNRPELLTFAFKGGPTEDVPSATPPGEAKTYDDAIKQIGAAYVEWRYIYEKFGESMAVAISFEPLYFLARTVNEVSGTYEGNTKISIKDQPPNEKEKDRSIANPSPRPVTLQLPNPLKFVSAAIFLFLFATIFIACGFLAPESLGRLISPHSRTGSIGMTVALLIYLVVFAMLLVFLPMTITRFIVVPEGRTFSSWTLVISGVAIAITLGIVLALMIAG